MQTVSQVSSTGLGPWFRRWRPETGEFLEAPDLPLARQRELIPRPALWPQQRAEALAFLELQPGAIPSKIGRAFRQRALALHPDRPGGDPEAFKLLQHHYDVLKGQAEAAGQQRLITDQRQ